MRFGYAELWRQAANHAGLAVAGTARPRRALTRGKTQGAPAATAPTARTPDPRMALKAESIAAPGFAANAEEPVETAPAASASASAARVLLWPPGSGTASRRVGPGSTREAATAGRTAPRAPVRKTAPKVAPMAAGSTGTSIPLSPAASRIMPTVAGSRGIEAAVPRAPAARAEAESIPITTPPLWRGLAPARRHWTMRPAMFPTVPAPRPPRTTIAGTTVKDMTMQANATSSATA